MSHAILSFLGLLAIAICVLFIVGMLITIRNLFSQWKGLDRRQKVHAAITTVFTVLFSLGWVNFLAFAVISIAIGGEACSGRVVGERYYVASHGKYTEVSRAVWSFSWYHGYSNFVTGPLAVLGLAFLALKQKTIFQPPANPQPPAEGDMSRFDKPLQDRNMELSCDCDQSRDIDGDDK
jgi:hypothetical protein